MPELDDDLPKHWPRAGDRLFVQNHCSTDAQIATYRGERLYRMKRAFKAAGDLLVGQTEEDTYERINLVWPVVFCYRQYIELALKDMIAEHGSSAEPAIEPNWKDHGLLPLWQSYKKLIDETLCEASADDLPEVTAVEACIKEFERVDPGSYTFRYPTNKKGEQVNMPFQSLNLWHLRNVMEGIYVFLDATESALDAHFDISYQ